MPSEKRRQRQQRVRHEVGDFVQTPKEELVENNKTNNVSDEKVKKEIGDEKIAEIRCEEIKETPTPILEGNSFRRKDERKHHQRNNETVRGAAYRGGGHARGGRRPEHEPPHQRTVVRASDSHVAYQEERVYEPVMIMESKNEAEKEVIPTLPEPTKYRRSEVISNWLRYEDLPPEDEPQDGEDYLMGEDFSQLLNLNVNKSSGGFLQLKGEMCWGSMDQSHLENHGLGALKIADLIASLGTIPFYQQLRIPQESLPVFLASTMKSDAEKRRASYRPNQEYVTDIEINQKILESLKLTENELIELSPEEPEPCITHNAIDATLKFSSSFKPEPTDVNLDALLEDTRMEEDSPGDVVVLEEASSQSKPVESSSLMANKLSDDVDAPESDTRAKKSIEEQQEKVISSQTASEPNLNKTQFNFGLSKTNKSTKKEAKKFTDEVQPTISQEIPLQIDLNKPTTKKKDAPVLVKKSEVENLEDWLDSVLDD